MRPIAFDFALYIKLGRGGGWEEECIQHGLLRFGYRETPHEWCIAGNWRKVLDERTKARGSASVAKGDVTQIRFFYEADERVLWVTFYKHALWWCFAKPEVTLLKDRSKVRQTFDGWRSTDISEQPLLMSVLSGKLLSMQGFRGTICQVKEQAYLLSRLNASTSPEVTKAKASLLSLQRDIEAVIRRLSWRDFELLVDLIFRQAGWQRASDVGSTIKSLDLDLFAPISSERYGIQVKSKADRLLFSNYKEERLKNMQGFARFYFAVHTPSSDLADVASREDDPVRLLLPADISKLAVSYGLAEWAIEKAG